MSPDRDEGRESRLAHGSADKDEICDLITGQVRELMKLVNETNIAELRIERGDLKLYISKGQSKDPLAELGEDDCEALVAGEPEEVEAYIVAPLVGRFYRSAPGKGPLVECGDCLAKGQKVCIVESMKILNDIKSEVEGQIAEILCEDGQAVEYSQPLFRVRLNQPAASSEG